MGHVRGSINTPLVDYRSCAKDRKITRSQSTPQPSAQRSAVLRCWLPSKVCPQFLFISKPRRPSLTTPKHRFSPKADHSLNPLFHEAKAHSELSILFSAFDFGSLLFFSLCTCPRVMAAYHCCLEDTPKHIKSILNLTVSLPNFLDHSLDLGFGHFTQAFGRQDTNRAPVSKSSFSTSFPLSMTLVFMPWSTSSIESSCLILISRLVTLRYSFFNCTEKTLLPTGHTTRWMQRMMA